MPEWNIEFHDEFHVEFSDLSKSVQDELLALLILLREFGPSLGRPAVDTLNASKHHNLKELRFNADGGVWRVAFAFDPKRHAILLIAGDKSGANQKQFYKKLIKKADKRFDAHLLGIKGE
jgi:hypothetical protein